VVDTTPEISSANSLVAVLAVLAVSAA